MKMLKLISAFAATAILCTGFAACSKDKNDESVSFGFTYADVITNTNPTTAEAVTTAVPASARPTDKPTTAKPKKTTKAPTTDTEPTPTVTTETTTKKPYTLPTRETTTTTQAPTTTTTLPPTTQPTTPPPPTTTAPIQMLSAGNSASQLSMSNQVLSLINDERQSRGLGELRFSAELYDAAQERAQEQYQMGSLSHTRPDGSDWYTISELAMAENLAMGQNSPQSVYSAWYNSSGHKDNMLNPDHSTAGIGCYYDKVKNIYYWVMLSGY